VQAQVNHTRTLESQVPTRSQWPPAMRVLPLERQPPGRAPWMSPSPADAEERPPAQ
jgi:hypothetical protein